MAKPKTKTLENVKESLPPAMRWGMECRDFLNGKTIKNCRYLTKEELDQPCLQYGGGDERSCSFLPLFDDVLE